MLFFSSSFPVATMLPKFSRQQVCHDLSFFIICQICDNSNILWTIEWNLISNIMYHNPSTLQPELLNFYAPIVSCDISISRFMIFEAITFSFVAKYCQVQHWRPFKVTSLRTLKFRLLCQRIWQSFTTLLQLNNSPSQRECYKWQIRVFFVWLKVDQLAPSKIIHLHCRSCSVPLSRENS